MKKTLIILSIIILLLIGYSVWRGGQRATAPAVNEPAVTGPSARTVTVELAELNDSGEAGQATLTAENGKTRVTLNLSGAPENISQPAHIHEGSCPGIGPIKYPLTFPVNGASETLLDVSLEQLLAELPLAINVHKSVEEPQIYVACGDIAP